MIGLKIAISGKGGVGKSTLSAIWSKILSNRGNTVLAIDADPDSNLAHTLGVPNNIRSQIRPISLEKELISERTGALAGKSGQIFSLNPLVSDLISKYSISYDDVNLMVLGGVRKGGAGCACPESTFLKSLIRHCVLKNNETVILDMEAGIEHLGRATSAGVDALVIVTEAGTRSFETALHIVSLAKDLGMEQKLFLLLNKTRSIENELNKCTSMFPGIPVIGHIPFDERFIESDEQQRAFYDIDIRKEIIGHFEQALDCLIKLTTNKSSPLKECQ